MMDQSDKEFLAKIAGVLGEALEDAAAATAEGNERLAAIEKQLAAIREWMTDKEWKD